jgi:hypothetical protein
MEKGSPNQETKYFSRAPEKIFFAFEIPLSSPLPHRIMNWRDMINEWAFPLKSLLLKQIFQKQKIQSL